MSDEYRKQEDPSINGRSGEDEGADRETTRRGGSYYSDYDMYRFRTPRDPGDREADPHEEVRRKNRSSGVRAFLAVLGIAVLIGAAAGLISQMATGVSVQESVLSFFGGKPGPQPQRDIVFGNRKEDTPEDGAAASGTEAPSPEQEEGVSSDPAKAGQAAGETAPDADRSGSSIGSGEGASSNLKITEIVRKAMPSMVSIATMSVKEYNDLFGGAKQETSRKAGSGIIVGKSSTELLIATNNHLVQEAEELTITFVDDEAVSGEVKGADADNDIAIIGIPFRRIPRKTQEAIAVISICDREELQVGETVVAIGNALGYGQSVSAGIISALGCVLKDADGSVHTLIQTDASINPGNSGGALLNLRGELVGINEAKYVSTNVEGVGYAIPMSTAMPILEDIGSRMTRSKVSGSDASYLGITCISMPASYTDSGYPKGVYVVELEEGGPAEKAGLLKGDIITAFGGASVPTQESLIEELTYYSAEEEVRLSVSRFHPEDNSFEKLFLTVKLGRKSDMVIGSEGSEGGEAGAESAPEAIPEAGAESAPEAIPEAGAEPQPESPHEEDASSGPEEAEETPGTGSGRQGIPGGRYHDSEG